MGGGGRGGRLLPSVRACVSHSVSVRLTLDSGAVPGRVGRGLAERDISGGPSSASSASYGSSRASSNDSAQSSECPRPCVTGGGSTVNPCYSDAVGARENERGLSFPRNSEDETHVMQWKPIAIRPRNVSSGVGVTRVDYSRAPAVMGPVCAMNSKSTPE